MFRKKSKIRQRQGDSSSQASIYSYYSNGARKENSAKQRLGLQTAKPKAGSSNKWWQHIPSVLAGLVILISLGYVLTLNSNPKIIQPADSGSIFLQDINTYKNAAHKLFNQSFLNKNKITVNVSGVTAQLQNQFPELENVSITLPLIGHSPIVYINPSSPAIVLNAQNGSYVLNDKGIAIIPAYRVKNLSDLNLPTIDDKSNISVILGQGTLSTQDISFIKKVFNQLNAQKVTVGSIVLPSSAEELDIKVKGKPYFIKMNMLGDAREEVGAYLAANANLQKQNKQISYYDVRVEGRVYYK